MSLPHHILMCRIHWGMVPLHLRRQVVRHWNGGEFTDLYLTVREAAIAFVEAVM